MRLNVLDNMSTDWHSTHFKAFKPKLIVFLATWGQQKQAVNTVLTHFNLVSEHFSIYTPITYVATLALI